MKARFAVAFFAAVVSFPAAAEPHTYTVDSRHTFPSFEIMHLGVAYQRGRFDKTTGTIALDLAAKKGSAEISIEMASVSTGVPKLDERLRGDEFFDAAKFPHTTFRASAFDFEGDKVTGARGEITMHGVTRPVTFKATYFNCAPHPILKKNVCGAELIATIQRSQFGITYGPTSLSDDVILRVNVEAIKDT